MERFGKRLRDRMAGLAAAAILTVAAGPLAAAACPERLRTAADLALCSAAANGGDTRAALQIGDAMADPGSALHDPGGARSWWDRAAEQDEPEALRRLFDSRWYGRAGPRDPAEARRILERAVAAGAPWARLVRALLAEAEAPPQAAAGYQALATEGNCLAELRLAHAYDRGGMVERDPVRALYWAEIAARQEAAGPSASHPLFETRFHYGDCRTEAFFFLRELAQNLPDDRREQIRAQAAGWHPGEPVASVAGAALPAVEAPRSGPSPAATGPATDLPPWRPLPAALRRPAGRQPMPAETLFATVGRSVYVVVAAASDDEMKAGRGRFGSAVAMDERTLVTNCHVVAGLPMIWLRQGGQTLRAGLAAADPEGDRCLLVVSPGRLAAVPGVRGWDDLKVGETVYSIGAPRGLEATLGQGLVSGLRTVRGLHLVQTSAPLSPGSSGGGLFDAAGNLVGITSFRLRESEGLNFAISVDAFF